MNRNTTPITRPAGTPAYYLGRSATVWQTALRRRTHWRTEVRPSVDRTRGRFSAAANPGARS